MYWTSLFPCLRQPLPITRDDEEWAQEGLEFIEGRPEEIDLEQLNDIFCKVGFPCRDETRLMRALENTYKIVWVRSTKKTRVRKEGQILGFSRATSDGEFNAVIWDVVVAPAWQVWKI